MTLPLSLLHQYCFTNTADLVSASFVNATDNVVAAVGNDNHSVSRTVGGGSDVTEGDSFIGNYTALVRVAGDATVCVITDAADFVDAVSYIVSFVIAVSTFEARPISPLQQYQRFHKQQR